jgi:translocation and assembly module TamB
LSRILKKFFKILGICIGILLVLILALILFIRSPWGQGIIVDKAVSFVQKKTGADIRIGRLFITFSGNLYLEELYLADLDSDTLFYSKNLEVGIGIPELINSGTIRVKKLDWEGVKARVYRDAASGKFNFDFLTEAFASDSVSTEETDASNSEQQIILAIESAEMREFDLSFKDEIGGIDAELKLGKFAFEVPLADLGSYDFKLGKIELKDSQITYLQSKPFPEEEEKEDSVTVLPLVQLEELVLSNVSLSYKNLPDQLEAQIKLGHFLAQLPEGNLRDQIIKLTKVELLNSTLAYKDLGSTDPSPTEPTEESSEFTWPEWDVSLDKFRINSTHLSYQTSETGGQKGEFNPQFIQVSDFSFDAEEVLFQPNLAAAKLKEFSFREGSGFELKKFSFDLTLRDQGLDLDNFLLYTNRSQLEASGKVSYASIADLIAKPEQSQLNLRISPSSLDLRDSFFFSRDLEKDTLIRDLAKSPLSFQAQLVGTADEMDIQELLFGWSKTRFEASGKVWNLMDAENLRFDFPSIQINSTRSDLIRFVKEEDLGIKLPEYLAVRTSLNGKPDHIQTETALSSSLGDIWLSGVYQNQQVLAFQADLKVSNLLLGELLQTPDLDTLSLSLQTSGTGKDLYSMDAKLQTTFEKLGFNGTAYNGVRLNGELQNGNGQLTLVLAEKYLDFDFLATVQLDSVRSQIGLNLDLKGADFYQMGFAEKTSRAKLKLAAKFDGNPESFTANAQLFDGTLVYGDKTYLMGELDLSTILNPDTTGIKISSKILNGQLGSNSSPEQLQTALTSLFSNYLEPTTGKDDPSHLGVNFQMDLTLIDDPLLSEVLMEGLENFDTAKVKIDFIESKKFLEAAIDFPYINYGGTEIDSLRVRINGNEKDLNFNLGFLGMSTGPILMEQTGITGVLDDSQLKLDFLAYQQNKILTHIPFEIELNQDTVKVHLSPEDLIFNGVNWTIPKSNKVFYSQESLQFRDFNLQNGAQTLSILHDLEGYSEKNIATEFSNFQLETFTRLLNPEDTLASGALEGKLVVENPFGATGILGKLSIQDLYVMNTPLGKLDLNAEANGAGNYQLNLALQDNGLDFELDGEFVADESGGTLDFEVDLRKLAVEKIASLSQGQLQNGQGHLSGKVIVAGTVNEPVYSGEFIFTEASILPTQLSTAYLLSNEKIRLDNDGIYFDQFTLRDLENNTFILDGKVSTTDLANPGFELRILAKNFMAINTENKENEMVYGKAILDADVKVNGNLNLPLVVANLSVRERTDLTLVIPESELDLIARDGVVIFVNKSDPNDILTRSAEETSGNFTGFSVQALLKVDPKAKFKVIIDPSTGDNLSISGESNLQLDINPNGRITLSGIYEVKDGSYEMTLYNLISKKFDISEGSKITWNGDPMDASLDIRAIYKVETAAKDLMATQLSGYNSEVKSQYQQKLDFLVYLNVKGDLLKPEITFSLDMPEAERSALGGNVYSRILQLNEQEDELNKQVLSLLVLDRFFPSQGSDGSSGGAEAIARNSASQLLSDQMNALSSKFFGDSGFSLGFGIDTYQDYQTGSPENRTDLNINAQQKLFNDRLVVQVGSQMDLEGGSQDSEQSNSILANISLEYTLTEDGRWRIRAFRKNEFQSIIDGQLFVTGVGLIFNREFNELKELWRKPLPPREIPNEEQENKQQP